MVNPLLSKGREAPNPQTLGCARDALSGAWGTRPRCVMRRFFSVACEAPSPWGCATLPPDTPPWTVFFSRVIFFFSVVQREFRYAPWPWYVLHMA